MGWNFWALLSNDSGDKTGETGGGGAQNWIVWVVLAVAVVLIIVWFIFSNRKNKSRQKEYAEQMEAICPGNKVKSTGGLCGVVVEVCDDNTVIIETGSETTGKSYFKLDKDSIYQTDAKGATQIAREQAEAAKNAEKAAKAEGAAPEKTEAPEKAEVPEKPAAEDAPEAPAETPVQKDE